MPLTKLSNTASSFPTVEVSLDDFYGLQYRRDGRMADGALDCLGVVIEVFRLIGLGLPDPKYAGRAAFDFSELFSEVSAADTLYDIVHTDNNHVAVVVRIGQVAHARERVGFTVDPLRAFSRITGAKYWRVRTDALPT